MEELSIEEKAKAFDEALERARKLQENSNGMILKKWLWNIFPELAESEDERIRKVLVELVKCNERCGYFMINNITTSAMLAWLEKQQGEQNPTDNDMIEALRTEYEKGRADAIAEMQVAWSEDDEKMVNNILTPLAVRYPFNIYQPMYNWLKSLKQRIGG